MGVFAKLALHRTYIVMPLQPVDSNLPRLFCLAFTNLYDVSFNVLCYLPLVHLSCICGIILVNFAFATDLNNLSFCSLKSLCGGFYLGHSYCRQFYLCSLHLIQGRVMLELPLSGVLGVAPLISVA